MWQIDGVIWVRWRLSLRLHAQLSPITAVLWLCYSIRQLQLSWVYMPVRKSKYWLSMSYPGMIGGTVVISTSGNRATSGWSLYITSNNKLCLGIRERWLLLAVISEERCRRHRPSTSGSQSREKLSSLRKTQISDPIWWSVYIHTYIHQSNNLGVLIWLWEIRSSLILVRLWCIQAS